MYSFLIKLFPYGKKFRTEALKITSCTHPFYLIQESTIRLHTRLSQLGFDIKKEKIFSSLSAAKAVVAERQLNPLLILEDAAKEVMKNVKFLFASNITVKINL